MKKTLFNVSILLMVALFSVVTACRKDNGTSTDQAIAEDITAHNDIIELITTDADQAIDGFISDEPDERTDCPTVSFAQPKGTWPNTMTLDYSDAGCTKAGRTYQGKIVVNQTGPINQLGSVRSLTFDNFYFEGVKVEGTKTVTNAGANGLGQPYFNVSVKENLTFPDASTATYNSDRVRTIVEGSTTVAKADDVWNITGGATGTNRDGISYSSTITTPLVKVFTCPWLSEGVIEFTVNTNTRSLDFGDGTCDRDATLTFADGTAKEVKIRHRWWR